MSATARQPLTQDRLKELLHYDPETGNWMWLQDKSSARCGDEAGTVTTQGYRVVKLDGKLHRLHRLAWLYITGSWPLSTVDHINGVRLDNRWANLRTVSQRSNCTNKAAHRAGRLPGCYYWQARGRWRATVSINGQSTHIGMYATEQEAHQAYLRALEGVQ